MSVEETSQSALRVRATRIGPEGVCLTVAGDLDVGGAGVLATEVRAALCLEEPDAIKLDLNRLDFIDVAGVRTLFELHDAAAAAGCELSISEARPATRWVLTVLGLGDLLSTTPEAPRLHREPGS